jgi:hypothetical protein
MRSFLKQPRGANRQLLDLARGQDCLLQSPMCNHDPATVVACHPRGVSDYGTGGHYKAGDEYSVWGCHACNFFTDQAKDASAEEKAELFAEARPRQIARWREIAASDRKEPRRRAALWALQQLGETLH